MYQFARTEQVTQVTQDTSELQILSGNGTCFVSPFWGLELGRGPRFLVNLWASVLCIRMCEYKYIYTVYTHTHTHIKYTSKAVPVHTMTAHAEIKVQLHSFLTSTTEGGEYSAETT
jgi:hypothetical protein